MKPCDGEPCKNGGTCSELENRSQPGFECACKEGYGGRTCQYFYGMFYMFIEGGQVVLMLKLVCMCFDNRKELHLRAKCPIDKPLFQR